MKLCRYWLPDSGPTLGLVDGSLVYNLADADAETFGSFSRMLGLENLPDRAERAAARVRSRAGLLWNDLDVAPDVRKPHLLAPVTKQEVWAAGVTYFRSREARMEESAGGGSFYDKVYYSDRPELFLKGTSNRVAGPNAAIRIRKDSRWNVPEPELALLLGPAGSLVAFTAGNDVSSRDIEGENPLYLPQAKVYKGSCALGPAFVLADSVPDVQALIIELRIRRGSTIPFEGSARVAQMKRTLKDLVSYLFREQEFPYGVLLLTGTGIVPPDDFTLMPGDIVEITIPEIGTLRNPVAS
ncbi:MAG: fumarylacetoacetate hydrolase [Acidobacteria bacterium]|nr:MAG: fumarylacetoacetate hydrolase [Acidobacteriota bacterium]